MKVSKNVKNGSVVVWRGDKIIKASKRSKKVVGVWRDGFFSTILTDYDKIENITVPRGVAIYGTTEVRVK